IFSPRNSGSRAPGIAIGVPLSQEGRPCENEFGTHELLGELMYRTVFLAIVCWHLDRKLVHASASKNTINVTSSSGILRKLICAVGQQAACFNIRSERIDDWQFEARREGNDQIAMCLREDIGWDDDPTIWFTSKGDDRVL